MDPFYGLREEKKINTFSFLLLKTFSILIGLYFVDQVVQVDVWNVGKRGYKKHHLGCGEATIDIKSIVGNGGDRIVLNIPLLFNNIASQGTVSLRLKVFPVDETGKRSHLSLQVQESPKSRYNVLCEIENLRVSDLINTGTLADHQDPSLTITLDGRSFQTERFRYYTPHLYY